MNFKPTPVNSPLTTRPVALDHAVANLCGVFGRGSLVAVPRGVSAEAVPAPLITEADSPGYLRRLATSDIAVCLGGHPGLAAIEFADISGLNEFLARNPSCAETLITAHAAGPIVWLRAITAHRAPLVLPQLHVLMNGNLLVYDRHVLHSRDEFLNIVEIKEVDLFAVDWGTDPDGQVSAWLVTLTHGEFVRRTQRGHIIPRRDAWRDYLVRRLKPATAFDRATGGFWRKRARETWQPLTEEQLIGEVRQLVTTAPVPGTQSHSWCNDEWLAGMLRYLRRALACQLPLAICHLRTFARAALTLSPGRDVTAPELYPAYVRFCRERDLPILPQRIFQNRITVVLREPPWLKAKSKSVPRCAKSQNGFRGLALRLVV